nr:uncharacterized protein LOC129261782 [Lytechinus pictus]
MTAEETETSVHSVPSPDFHLRSPQNSDSGISDDQRSPASSHDGDGHVTDDLTLDMVDMSTFLVGSDAMLTTDTVSSTTVDSISASMGSPDSFTDAAFTSSLSSSPTSTSKNILPMTQKDISSSEKLHPMLVLTDEEMRFIERHGVTLPTDVPQNTPQNQSIDICRLERGELDEGTHWVLEEARDDISLLPREEVAIKRLERGELDEGTHWVLEEARDDISLLPREEVAIKVFGYLDLVDIQ